MNFWPLNKIDYPLRESSGVLSNVTRENCRLISIDIPCRSRSPYVCANKIMHKKEKRYVFRALQVDRDNNEQTTTMFSRWRTGDATKTDCREWGSFIMFPESLRLRGRKNMVQYEDTIVWMQDKYGRQIEAKENKEARGRWKDRSVEKISLVTFPHEID